MRAFYRPDLHGEIKRICLIQSKEWKTPVLRLGSEVVSIVYALPIYYDTTTNDHKDIHHAVVQLKDGSLIKGDLIIGADGERVSLFEFTGNSALNYAYSKRTSSQ